MSSREKPTRTWRREPAWGWHPRTAWDLDVRSLTRIWMAGLTWPLPTGTLTRPYGTFAATSATHSLRSYFSITAGEGFRTWRPKSMADSTARKSDVDWHARISTGTATLIFC